MLDHFLGKTVTDIRVIDADMVALYFGEERILFSTTGPNGSCKLVIQTLIWSAVRE